MQGTKQKGDVVVLYVKVPRATLDALDALSASEDRTKAVIVRRAIEAYAAGAGKRRAA